MTSTVNKVEVYLTQALAGSMAGQIAAERDLDITALIAPNSPELKSVTDELAHLGVHPRVLANHTLCALVGLFSDRDNADRITEAVTDLLWSILGDPKNGGSPPELYRRASYAVFLTFLGLLDPSFINLPTDD